MILGDGFEAAGRYLTIAAVNFDELGFAIEASGVLAGGCGMRRYE